VEEVFRLRQGYGGQVGVRVKKMHNRQNIGENSVQSCDDPSFPSSLNTEHRLVRRSLGEGGTPNTPNRRAGLTLIEVMLALVILGMGMVALVTAAGRAISVARQAKNFDTARELLARVEVEQPMMLEEEVEDIAGSGSFESPYEAFSWTRTVEPEGFEEDGLWRVETEIKWTEDQRGKKERVATLIYWPEDKEGGSVESAP
jgi:prepilin-type N-terminal cleavage/methylation domain-containing protein